jgi:hypothetical protein
VLVVAVHQLEYQLALWRELATLAAVSRCEFGWRLHEWQGNSEETQFAIRANKKSMQTSDERKMAQNSGLRSTGV